MALARRAYTAVQVTLTSANTNYEILALVNAVLAAANAEAPGACREFNIQSHAGIDGTGANTKDVLIGDGELSATRFGYLLPVGASRTYRADYNGVIVSGIYARSSAASQKLNVEIVAA